MATALLPVEATSLVLANNKDNFVYVCMIVVSQCSGSHNIFLTCHDKCLVSREVWGFFFGFFVFNVLTVQNVTSLLNLPVSLSNLLTGTGNQSGCSV